MKRREFLRCLGVFAASAYLPAHAERICRAPKWAKDVVVFRTLKSLAPGAYTFTAAAGLDGMYVAGFTALGGETLFEVPVHPDTALEKPRIKLGGLHFSLGDSLDFTDPETIDALQRGEIVERDGHADH